MRVLGIVTARGGSKGIPRKNLADLGGRPLLAWTAEAAKKSRRLTRTVLSTEDAEIAEVGRQVGLEVPFLRPSFLAEDNTPTLPVLQDVVKRLEAEGQCYDAVCLLQPTSPFRSDKDIDGCIEMLETCGADAVVTVRVVPTEYNPHWTYFMNEHGMLRLSTGEGTPIARRQQLPLAYHRDGSIYITRRDVLVVSGSLYGERLAGYLVYGARQVNIDRPADLERARALAASLCLSPSERPTV